MIAGERDEARKGMLTLVQRNVARLARLVDSLMDAAKASGGRLEGARPCLPCRLATRAECLWIRHLLALQPRRRGPGPCEPLSQRYREGRHEGPSDLYLCVHFLALTNSSSQYIVDCDVSKKWDKA